VSVNRKNREIVSARLGTRFVMVSNELPELPDAAGALAARMVVLPFPRSFLGSEDTGLSNRLLTELPGIALKALDALDRLRTRGFLLQPASGAVMRDEFAAAASPVAEFVRDRCVVRPDECVGAKELYAAWQSWCREQGIDRPGPATAFGQKLRAAKPALAKRRGAGPDRPVEYLGIGLPPAVPGYVPPPATPPVPPSTPAAGPPP